MVTYDLEFKSESLAKFFTGGLITYLEDLDFSPRFTPSDDGVSGRLELSTELSPAWIQTIQEPYNLKSFRRAD